MTEEIEKAKLDAVNEINKRMDEKLLSSLKIFKFVVWSICFVGIVLISALGFWGYRGYSDIQRMVEMSAKENAKKIIDSPEFLKKIDSSLGLVVEQKINDLNNLSTKLNKLKSKISGSDTRQVVHNLFSDIEPRLRMLEKLEKNNQVQVNENDIDFLSEGRQVFSIQYGEKVMASGDFKNLPTNLSEGLTKKIFYKKPFSENPKVFVQIDKNIDNQFIKERLQINSVKCEKDGFIITFSRISKVYTLTKEGIKLSWIALGK